MLQCCCYMKDLFVAFVALITTRSWLRNLACVSASNSEPYLVLYEFAVLYALSPLHIQRQVEEYKKTSNFLIEIMVLNKLLIENIDMEFTAMFFTLKL